MRSSHRRKAGQSAVSWESKHFFPHFFFFFAVVTTARPLARLTDEQSLSAALHVPADWIRTLPVASAPARWSIIHQLVNKNGNKNESRPGGRCLCLLSLGFGFKEVVAVDSLSLFYNGIRLIFNNKSVFLCFINLASLNFLYILCYIKEFFNSS